MTLLAVVLLAQNESACPEVEIGGAQTYACLNQRLRHAADTPRIDKPGGAPTATDDANKTGTFSEAGTRERLGNAFGKSGVPQRPTQK